MVFVNDITLLWEVQRYRILEFNICGPDCVTSRNGGVFLTSLLLVLLKRP